MPPIPVHIDDPITPQKAEAITPQTADSGVAAPSPASVAATTTQSAQPAYPAARPGAAAVPAPTPYMPRPQPEPSRTTPTHLQHNGPPPPQPGAVPSPYARQPSVTATNPLPPPPRPGQAAQQTPFTSMVDQMHRPPPQQNYAPTHSTTTAGIPVTPQRTGPTTLNLGPVASPPASGNHPPGYVQNVYAQELSPAQRASLDQERRRPSFVDMIGLGSGANASDEKDTNVLGGEATMLDTAKGWLSKAGETLAEGHQEVWKRLNGGK